MPTYIFTKEVRRWGVEAGDYYNPGYHLIAGGTQRLLDEGTIEEETPQNHNTDITDHKFRNRCMGNCIRCDKEEDNQCSVVINDYGKTCNKTRKQHT